MDRQFFSGNSLQQAVMSAARYFSIDPERVAYSVRDKKHGFVGGPGGRRRVIIEVDPSSPEREAESSTSDRVTEDAAPAAPEASGAVEQDRRAGGLQEPQGRREPRVEASPVASWQADLSDEWSPAESDEDVEIAAARQAAAEIFGFLGVEADVTIEKSDGILLIDIEESNPDVWTQDHGRLLQSVEHLLPRMIRGFLGRGAPCRVDFQGFRDERETAIEEAARALATEVASDGENRRLEPMSPGDRRVAHMALADDQGVTTRSEGDGFLKRVVIAPR